MNCSSRVPILFRLLRRVSIPRQDSPILKHFAERCVIKPNWRLSHSLGENVMPNNTTNTEINFDSLTNGDTNLEKQLKILALEVDIWRQEGERVPSHIREEEWKELVQLQGKNARRKFLIFCWKKEMKRLNAKQKKETLKLEKVDIIEEKKKLKSDPLNYSLGCNSFFLRFRETSMNNFFNWKLIQAMLFSQKVVIDCGYDKHMSSREVKNCGKQLMLLFSENRMHINPFDIYFCSAERGQGSMREFEKFVVTAYEPHFPLNITEKSYLDLFPKEKLVYLTPHCREELLSYDHDAVYIIGGLVDKAHSEPLSLARAKEQGLKMAKLPLDRHLLWGAGSGKSLTLNQMIMILLDIRHTGDWSKALQHVPSRKIQSTYKVDYNADHFKLVGNSEQKSKDVYNRLIHYPRRRKL